MTLSNWPVTVLSQEKKRTGIPSKLVSWNGHSGTTMVTAGMFEEVDVEDAKSKKEIVSAVSKREYCHMGSKGWRSGESTLLPPVWPGFKSQCQHHMWVEFVVGSLPCSERFSSGYSGFPFSLKTNTFKFQSDLERTDTFQRVHKNS